MELVLSTLRQVFSMQTLPEWAVLFVAILVGMITRRRLIQKLGDSGSQSKGLRQFAIRSIERLSWPFSMLLVVWLGQIALASLQTTPILDVAVPLLFSFAAIRFIVYFLRKSIKGGPLLKASESFIAATI